MFKNNNMRPAFATAGSDTGSASRFSQTSNDFLSFAQSESDDFGSFQAQPKGSKGSKPAKSTAPKGNTPKKKSSFKMPKFNFSPKIAIIIAAAVLALVLIIVLVVAIIAIPKNGITMKDNVYYSYMSSEGKWQLAVNGKIVKSNFAGEVKLEPAKDNSFAYVFDEADGDENSEGTIAMYILKGTKLEEIKVPADKVLATADYKPGIVYKSGNSYYHYSAENGDNFISDISKEPSNFVISGDGTTVLYTEGDDTENEMKTYYCKGGQSYDLSAKELLSKGQIKPEMLSNDGKYVYLRWTSSNTGFEDSNDVRLAYLTAKEKLGDFEFTQVLPIFTGYDLGEIRAMNEAGNEFVIDAEKSGEVASYFCSIAKKSENNVIVKLATGIFTPIITSDNVVCPETLYDTYFTCKLEPLSNDNEDEEDEEDTSEDEEIATDATYVIKKEKKAPKAVKLADALGTFSPDGKYFYYLAKETLFSIELGAKEFKPETAIGNVQSFHVVENGNIYFLQGLSIKYKDGKRNDRVVTFDEEEAPSKLTSCNNTIFYMDGDEGNEKLFYSTSSDTSKEVKFSTGTPVAVPEIIAGSGKKAYVTFESADQKTYLYYTKNGESMRFVGEILSDGGNSESEA